jgi:hypothetical protein
MRNLAAATMIAALLATLALAPRAGAAPRSADLALKSVSSVLPSPAYLMLTRDQLNFTVRVTNTGPDATIARGAFRVIGAGGVVHSVRFRTPSIRPGRAHVEQVPLRSGDVNTIARYRTRACVASIRDRNTRNNCRNGPRFTVLPMKWVGRVEAWAPFDPFDGTAIERSVAEGSYMFAGVQKGVFFYGGAGPVTYSVSGSYGGCDYGGGATLNIDETKTGLQLRPDLTSYYGTGIESDEHYAITVTCGILGPRPPEQGPKNLGWWVTRSKEAWARDKRKIAGTNADVLGRTWKWDLNPE